MISSAHVAALPIIAPVVAANLGVVGIASKWTRFHP